MELGNQGRQQRMRLDRDQNYSFPMVMGVVLEKWPRQQSRSESGQESETGCGETGCGEQSQQEAMDDFTRVRAVGTRGDTVKASSSESRQHYLGTLHDRHVLSS